jgi:hypothetical protein
MMDQLTSFLQLIADQADLTTLRHALQTVPQPQIIYPDSLNQSEGTTLFMVKTGAEKFLFAAGAASPLYAELEGTTASQGTLAYKKCPLTIANSKIIRKYFAFTNPRSLANHSITIGLGDRLGLATPGHLCLFKGSKSRPVLAQQSTRELFLTGRSFAGVLADATWGVFQTGYRDGYGADGDHLKNAVEVRSALDEGYTMITLDCSEHIRQLDAKTDTEVEKLYQQLAADQRRTLENAFLKTPFVLKSGLTISFTAPQLQRYAAVYQKAVTFAIQIYKEVIAPAAQQVDFEISIDETLTPTEPAAHFFVAWQLVQAGVKVNSLAPRFCGEFQKGIDYIGDLAQFEREFKEHYQIASHFGYKISVHSGSDKFSVFPIIGRESPSGFHLKTAGTNWLEAIRVVIATVPALYREIHTFALAHFEEATKYYHVTTDLAKIPVLDSLTDAELPKLMDQNDSRQLLHITYGLILQAKDANGQYLYRDRLYRCWNEHEDLYYQFLQKHIGRHLKELGVSEA